MFRRSRPRLPYAPEKEADWDLLWIGYFKREVNQQLSLQKETQRPSLPETREEMIEDDKLFLGCDRGAIVGQTVLEVGCGAGYLPKLLAHHTKQYLGIDWSGLALLVAKRTCPEHTAFIHPTDERALDAWAGKVDTVLCRHFVIHQNLERMRSLLAFEAVMLRPGGRVYADFWLDNPGKHDGHGVWDAGSPDPGIANAVYRFSDEHRSELAESSGLRLVEDYPRRDKLRRFVTFEKVKA